LIEDVLCEERSVSPKEKVFNYLQKHPSSTEQLSNLFGYSDRQIRRYLKDLNVIRTKTGRNIIYRVNESVSHDIPSASYTTMHAEKPLKKSSRDLGDMSPFSGEPRSFSGKKIPENSGHHCGHKIPKNSKQEYRIRKREAKGHGHAQKSLQSIERSEHLPMKGISSCPQSYSHVELDKIQLVLTDKKFSDLLKRRIMSSVGWEVTCKKGQTVIHVNSLPLKIQLFRNSVVFNSYDPGDMSKIIDWVRKTFADEYGDIDSLITRLKSPLDLCSGELTVVIDYPDIIEDIRSNLTLNYLKLGQYLITAPNDIIPGLKIYERDDTMRVEFLFYNSTQHMIALKMRVNLEGLLPKIHETPEVFRKLIDTYYHVQVPPIIICPDNQDHIQSMEQEIAVLKEKVNSPNKTRSKPPKSREPWCSEILQELDNINHSLQWDDIIEILKLKLGIDNTASRVFLAAYSSWAKTKYKGRVSRVDVSSAMTCEKCAISEAELTTALNDLIHAHLLEEDERYEIKFSDGGKDLGNKVLKRRKLDRLRDNTDNFPK
jgi:hypothetical protein